MTKIIIEKEIIHLEQLDKNLKKDIIDFFLHIPIIFNEVFNEDFYTEINKHLKSERQKLKEKLNNEYDPIEDFEEFFNGRIE